MNRGNKFRFISAVFLIVILIGMIILYHDVNHDNYILNDNNHKLSTQIKLYRVEKDKLEKKIFNRTREFHKISILLKSKSEEFDSYKLDTEQILRKNKDTIDQLNKDITRLQDVKRLQEITIQQLREDISNSKVINEDLVKNLTKQLDENVALVHNFKKSENTNKKVLTVSEVNKNQVETNVIQSPNNVNGSSTTIVSLKNNLNSNPLKIPMPEQSQYLKTIQEQQVLELPIENNKDDPEYNDEFPNTTIA